MSSIRKKSASKLQVVIPPLTIKIPARPRVARTQHVTTVAIGDRSKRATAPIENDPDDDYLSPLTPINSSREVSPTVPSYDYIHEEVSVSTLMSFTPSLTLFFIEVVLLVWRGWSRCYVRHHRLQARLLH